MKTIQIIILSLSVLVAGTLLYVHYEIDKVQMEMQQKEIDGLKRANEKQRDSLERQLTATRDSLYRTLDEIELAKLQTEIARLETKKQRQIYNGIRFIQYQSDTARNSELKKLYPTYKPL